MLHILKKLSFVFVIIFLIGVVSAANYWVNDPNDCPTSYQSQTCSGSDKVCGYSGGVTYCYDMSGVSAPGGSATSTSSYSGGYDGGYILDCYSYTGSEPFCTNNNAMRCDMDSTCNNVNRRTQCEANKWSGDVGDTTCTTCKSGYTYCDGSYEDGDGCEIQTGVTQFNHTSGVLEDNAVHNSSCEAECSGSYLDCDGDLGTGGTGCEILNGGACTVGVLSGTYSGCSGSSGNCVVTKSYFETGTETAYQTNDSLLWGAQYGTGYLINMTNGSDMMFGVNNSGCVVFPDGTTQCTQATDTNVSGLVPYTGANQNVDLGSQNITTTGSGFFTWLGSIGNFITGLFVQDINASGNVDISGNLSVDIDTLFVDSDNNRVGIGTTSPTEKLHLANGTFLQTPGNPVHVGSITDDATTELVGAMAIYVSGKYAYVAAYGDNGFEILDISDPSNPTHVGSIDDTECDAANNNKCELLNARSIHVSG